MLGRRACLALLVMLVVAPAADARLPRIPAGLSHRLELGLADEPGGAAALRASVPLGLRYQYLAGGVNTGQGWATWNSGGSFVSGYAADSLSHGATPVLTYYMLLQSRPAGGDEATADLGNLRNRSTMRAYYRDFELLLRRAASVGPHPVIVHVEPDLWGYVHQHAPGDRAAAVRASVASTRLRELRGLPNTASGFARALVRLRDRLAPNVRLAYHLSIWGTMHDIQYDDPGDRELDSLADRAAAFYRSLHARFDLAFGEFSDRDAGFKQVVSGDNGASWWNAGDFRRNVRFLGRFVRGARVRVAMWQIPLGNTRMRALDNRWAHFQDNRVQWLLDDPGYGHLRDYARAGVIAFLFGGGAKGTTCACDAAGDGVTNPPPIDGNDLASLSADDDGGFFRARARAYYASGSLRLP
jgi:hypothetical protein